MRHKLTHIPLRFTRLLMPWRCLKGGKRALFWVGVIAILLIIVPLVIETLSNTHKAQAAWFDGSYAYRQPITVTNSTGSTITNLQKLLTVNTSALVSAGKLQSNCYDLRFTNQNGKILPYYIDSGCNTTTTKVWVLINSLPANTSTIYMYYGNPSASQGSSSSQFDNVVGLVGYWTMNDASGSTVTDSSVDTNNGTATGTTISTGKYANDRSFNGSSDYIQAPDAASLRVGDPNFTFETWINPSSLSGCGTANCIIFNKENSYEWALSSNGHLEWAIANTTPGWAWEDTGIVIPTSQWTHVVLVYDGSHVKAYANGVLQSTINATGNINNTTYQNALRIGARGAPGGASSFFSGQIDDVHIYNTARTAQQIAKDYSSTYTIQTSGVNITYSFGSEAQAPGPVAYWKFDEGYGTTAHDSTSNGNNGTLSGTTLPTWQSKDQCISGKCLYFDGSTSYVQVPDPSNGSLDFGTNNFTASLWEKRTTSGTNILMGKRVYTTAGWVIYFSGNTLIVQLDDGTARGYSVGTLSDLDTWHQITIVVKRSTNQLFYYLDGQLQSTTDISATTGSMSNTTWLGIGRDSSDGSSMFQGFIDEPKIYPYARSSTQILSDYNSTLAGGGSAVLGATADTNLSNGLVGYWKMDEASWNGTSGEVKDGSGNGNNGTAAGITGTSSGTNTTTTLNDTSKSWATNIFANENITITGGTGSGQTRTISSNTATQVTVSSTWTTTPDATSTYRITPTTGVGKFGNGGVLNGSDDYVNAGQGASLNITNSFTFSAWIDPKSFATQMGIFDDWYANGGNGMYIDASTGNYYVQIAGWLNWVPAAATLNQWQHIVLTFNKPTVSFYVNGVLVGTTTRNSTPGVNASTLIGSNWVYQGGYTPSNDFNGSLDEVRIYNRALSASEVSQLYNWAPGPVVHLQMDENSGTTAHDSSGNSNNGTVNSGTWTQGKYGAGVKLNGNAGSNVSVPDFNY